MNARRLVLVALALAAIGAIAMYRSACPDPYVIDVRVLPPTDPSGRRVVQGSVRGCGVHRWSGTSTFSLTVTPDSAPTKSRTHTSSYDLFVEASARSGGSVSYKVEVVQNRRVVASKIVNHPSG